MPMSLIDELLAANTAHAAGHAGAGDAAPRRQLAVLTCMDARIDPLAVFGLTVGDAHVLRNSGARVTDDVLRGLALSTHALGVDTLVVLQHTGCALIGVTEEQLRRTTGADTEFLAIHDHAATLQADIAVIAATEYLAPLQVIAGMVYDVDLGTVTEHVRWARTSA